MSFLIVGVHYTQKLRIFCGATEVTRIATEVIRIVPEVMRIVPQLIRIVPEGWRIKTAFVIGAEPKVTVKQKFLWAFRSNYLMAHVCCTFKVV